jgi:hypothetical protein
MKFNFNFEITLNGIIDVLGPARASVSKGCLSIMAAAKSSRPRISPHIVRTLH